MRKRLYDTGILETRRLQRPVISVGNITTGGTGKTPTVIALARLLSPSGRGEVSNPASRRSKGVYQISPSFPRTAILTRGYKRRSKRPILVVSDGKEILSTPEDCGDEPYLIASALEKTPVIVGKDRYSCGRYAIEHFGTELFILDDGYQHIRLYRDINILLIDASNPFGNGHLLPRGIMREPLRAISRADCIIISRAKEARWDDMEGLIRTYNQKAPLFSASLEVTGLSNLKGDPLGLDYIAGKGVLILSGIGNPGSFRRSILEIGGEIRGEIVYPDHHWYTEKDKDRILKEARGLSVDTIVTTEKDAVRLMGMGSLSEVRDEILVLKVEMVFDKGFEDWIVRQVSSLFSPGAGSSREDENPNI